jgi:hypothetical protein
LWDRSKSKSKDKAVVGKSKITDEQRAAWDARKRRAFEKARSVRTEIQQDEVYRVRDWLGGYWQITVRGNCYNFRMPDDTPENLESIRLYKP